MPPVSHPGRLLKRELEARRLSANRLALALGVPSGRVTDILNGRRSITAETAVRLGRYFGNPPCFWLESPKPIRHRSWLNAAAVQKQTGKCNLPAPDKRVPYSV